MHVARVMEARWNPQGLRLGSDDSISSLNRLLHYVTQRTGFHHATLTTGRRHLNRQQLAAHRRPRQARDLADLVFLLGGAEIEFPHAENVRQRFRADGLPRFPLSQSKSLDHLAAHFGNLALQCPDPRFAGVVADDVQAGPFRQVDLIGLEPVELGLLGYQILLGDVEILILGVARDANHLHPIQQWPGDIHRVGGADKHHVRKIVVDLKIMVIERMILFGVEHFQHRRGRISTVIHPHLVDLVQQEKRVSHTGLRHLLEQLAGHGADIGSSMASDLRFVANATQGHPDKFSIRRASN